MVYTVCCISYPHSATETHSFLFSPLFLAPYLFSPHERSNLFAVLSPTLSKRTPSEAMWRCNAAKFHFVSMYPLSLPTPHTHQSSLPPPFSLLVFFLLMCSICIAIIISWIHREGNCVCVLHVPSLVTLSCMSCHLLPTLLLCLELVRAHSKAGQTLCLPCLKLACTRLPWTPIHVVGSCTLRVVLHQQDPCVSHCPRGHIS